MLQPDKKLKIRSLDNAIDTSSVPILPERGQQLSDSMAQQVVKGKLTYDQAMASDIAQDITKAQTVSISSTTGGRSANSIGSNITRKAKFKLDRFGKRVAF